MIKFIQKKGKKKAEKGKSKRVQTKNKRFRKMRDLTPEKQMRLISGTIRDQGKWDKAVSKLDHKLLKEALSTLNQGMKYMVSVKRPEPNTFKIVKQQTKYIALSFFKHLDETGFTKVFCKVAPLFEDFSFEKGYHLLLDDIQLFKNLGFPPHLWKAYCAYIDKHKQKFFLKIKKEGFRFMDLAPIVKAKMELKNDPIRKQSPFNWSCGIATGIGVVIGIANATAAVPSVGVSVASVIASGVGIGYSAGGGGDEDGNGGGTGSGSGG